MVTTLCSNFLSHSKNISSLNVYPKGYKSQKSFLESSGNISKTVENHCPNLNMKNNEQLKTNDNSPVQFKLSQVFENLGSINLLTIDNLKDSNPVNSKNVSVKLFEQEKLTTNIDLNLPKRKLFKKSKPIKKFLRRNKKHQLKSKQKINHEIIKKERYVSKATYPILDDINKIVPLSNIPLLEKMNDITQVTCSSSGVFIKIIKSFEIFNNTNEFYYKYILNFFSNLFCQLNNFNYSNYNFRNISDNFNICLISIIKMGSHKIILESPLNLMQNSSKYETRPDFVLLKKILVAKEQIFLKRDVQLFFYPQIIRLKLIRKKNREIQIKLRKKIVDIKTKSLTNCPKNQFKNDFLRQKGRQLAFQRKNMHFPWMFYATTIPSTILHIYNLFTKKKSEFNLYYSSSDWFGVTDHNGSIYIAGGHNKGGYLNSVWKFDISLSLNPNGVILNSLCEGKSGLTLLSTPFDIFAFGGYIMDRIKSCERFNNFDTWNFIASLNKASYGITAAFIYLFWWQQYNYF